jgi:arylsulfatase A-like enzyme
MDMDKKLTILALLGTVIAPSLLNAQKRPNIIWIMTDQQWAGAMSCAGSTDLHTPNMDRLASKGVRFTNAYCSMPLSGPSRSAMFTGYMPSETGMLENGMSLKDSLADNTLGTLIRNGGYDCAYAGKWHVGPVSLPEEESYGFNRIALNGDKGLAESCVKYLQSKHSTPFFLVASFTNPHNICEYARGQKTPDAFITDSNTNDCPNLPANFDVNPYDASILQYEKSLNYSLYPTGQYSNDEWRHYRNAYCKLIEAVDAEIGKIIDEIDRENLWKNTVVVFTSDHGDGTGAHHWNQKTALYEEVANIPLIVCLPGGKNAGMVSKALVNNGIDMMPSFCDWAGVSVPAGRKGTSFRSAAEKLAEGPDYIVTETNFLQTGGTIGWMVRTKDYKYVIYDKGKYREQLYDMRCDRGEMRNLAVESSYQDVLNMHRSLLRKWMESHHGPTFAKYIKMLAE